MGIITLYIVSLITDLPLRSDGVPFVTSSSPLTETDCSLSNPGNGVVSVSCSLAVKGSFGGSEKGSSMQTSLLVTASSVCGFELFSF